MVSANTLYLLAFVATCLTVQLMASSVIKFEQQNVTDGSGARILSSCGHCPSGFAYSVATIPKCYAVVTQPLNWDSAQAKCRQLNPKAHLVVINSALENQVISQILEGHNCPLIYKNFNSFWTSGRRRYPNCKAPIVWQPNARAYQALSYTNYCPGEPDCAGGLQFCINIAKTCYSQHSVYGWQEDICGAAFCSVCEVLKFE